MFPQRLLLVATAAIFLGHSLLAGRIEKAPEIQSSGAWIGAEQPLKLKSLRGSVVLIDFWAFDCEPCRESMPRIRELYDKYADRGLVVIGVHTPRTEDERDETKVREAVRNLDIRFPVLMDNKQKVWTDFKCDLWPTQFVIDRQGYIRLSRGGVNRYADVEEAVVAALAEK
ncbi:MAG TPA: redoxin domain-containing protein [Terriglobia bacterium]|nr:redoxin domain-containing protein [Terriglobia bacterium]